MEFDGQDEVSQTTAGRASIFRVEGDRRPLRGEVRPDGSKNASLPILAATLLAEGKFHLTNVPVGLLDVQVMLDLLRGLGVRIELDGTSVTLDTSGPISSQVAAFGSRIRYSLLFLGALGSRLGEARVPHPGGCRIGDRKFDLHLLGLRNLGAVIEEEEGWMQLRCSRLQGADVEFRLPTTSGTENVLLGAVLAQGRTTIYNANTRPEIRDLAGFLNSMGARVEVFNRIIEVEGVEALRPTSWGVMPGRDEAFTYVVGCGIRGGEIMIPGLTEGIMRAELEQVRRAGMEVFEWGGALYVSARKSLGPIDMQTAPYPGINSDLQPLFAALSLNASGISTITDTRFPDRFGYAEEMRKLGADIRACGNCAIVRGGAKLRGAAVKALDIRTGAALVLAGLAAEGTTTIVGIEQIDRGYDRIERKLERLGATIRREEQPS